MVLRPRTKKFLLNNSSITLGRYLFHIACIPFLFLSFWPRISYCQFERGTTTIGLGAELGFLQSKIPNNTYTQFIGAFNPNYAKFGIDNGLSGVLLGIRYELAKNNGSVFESKSFYVGTLYRRYWGFDLNKYGLFLTGSIVFGSNGIPFHLTYSRISIRPGAYLFISRKFALELSFAEGFFEARGKIKNYGIGILTRNIVPEAGLRYFIHNNLPQKRTNTKP